MRAVDSHRRLVPLSFLYLWMHRMAVACSLFINVLMMFGGAVVEIVFKLPVAVPISGEDNRDP